MVAPTGDPRPAFPTTPTTQGRGKPGESQATDRNL